MIVSETKMRNCIEEKLNHFMKVMDVRMDKIESEMGDRINAFMDEIRSKQAIHFKEVDDHNELVAGYLKGFNELLEKLTEKKDDVK